MWLPLRIIFIWTVSLSVAQLFAIPANQEISSQGVDWHRVYNESHPGHLMMRHILNGRKILAVGDSLTQGTFLSPNGNFPPEKHPYANMLRDKLHEHYPDVEVEEHGIGGEKVLGSMDKRLLRLLDTRDNLAFVLIWGGTNDILHPPYTDADSVLQSIIGMHKAVHEHGMLRQQYQNVYTVAATIHPFVAPFYEQGAVINDSAREYINQGLRLYARRCAHFMILQDFEAYYVDMFDKSNADNLKYWSMDELHFSKLGYDRLGVIFHETLLNFTHHLATHSHISDRNRRMELC